MKIVIASPFVRPEKGACIFRMNEFEKHFIKKGHKVQFFAPARSGVKKEKDVKRYNSRSELWKLVKETDFDVLIGTSPPMTNSFVAILTAKLKGKSVVLDVRDPWTYACEGLGIYSHFSPKLLLYKFIEKLSYLLVDKIFSVTDFTSGILGCEGADPEKIILVPNGTIPGIFKRVEAQGKIIRKKLGIPVNVTVLLYAGSFVKKGVDEMLAELKGQIIESNVRMLLLLCVEKCNQGEYLKLEEFVKNNGLEKNVVFVNEAKLSYGEIYKYFSAADFGLNPLPAAMDYCIPAKTYDYLAAGLPVISVGPRKSALKDFLAKHDAGFYFSSWAGLRKSFGKIVLDKKSLLAFRKKFVKIAPKEFDRKISAKKALKEIEGLLK